MLIIICGMIPSSIILPQEGLSLSIVSLNSSWQIHGLFLTTLLCGSQIGTISAISYLIIGLFYLPIFHGGGSIGYILTPQFGYLLGFIPATWACGFLAENDPSPNLIKFSLYTIISLFILHFIGIIYLIFGSIVKIWINNLFELFIINTLMPFPSQLLLCLPISLLSIAIKRTLLIK